METRLINDGKVFQELQKRKFKKNDIVSAQGHERLMVVEFYHKGGEIVVTEGGYYKEESLTLIFRRETTPYEISNRLRGMDQR